MNDQVRVQLMSLWAAVIVFISVCYLTGGFIKSVLVAAFVLGSCLLGLGRRWLFQGAFAIAILAIAVALGIPHPERWPDLFPGAFENARALVFR